MGAAIDFMIRRCNECPFLGPEVCDHPAMDQARMPLDEWAKAKYGAVPPAWCPMRERPVTLRVVS